MSVASVMEGRWSASENQALRRVHSQVWYLGLGGTVNASMGDRDNDVNS